MRCFLLTLFLPQLVFSAGIPGEEVLKDPNLADLFDLNSLPEIRLQAQEADWNRLLTSFDTNSKTEEGIPLKFTFSRQSKTESLEQVFLRVRGNTSRTRPSGTAGKPYDPARSQWKHANFGLDFSEYKKGQKFKTLEKLNLKYFKDDASYVREIYCLDLFHRFGVWTAPRSSYTKLFIQIGAGLPAYLGIYRMVEPIDQVFVERRFGKKDNGFLWKCLTKGTTSADLRPQSVKSGAGVKTGNQEFAYDLKTRKKKLDEARDALVRWTEELSQLNSANAVTWFEKKFGIDQFLRALAVHVAVGMWDDYWFIGNNYYLYMDKDSKVWFLPYDYDNTLGTSVLVSDAGTQDPLKWGPMGSNRPLIKKILDSSALTNVYKSNLHELIQPGKGLFSKDDSVQRIKTWQDMVSPYLANDTKTDQFLKDRPASWGNKGDYRLWTEELGTRNFFQTRVEAIEKGIR